MTTSYPGEMYSTPAGASPEYMETLGVCVIYSPHGTGGELLPECERLAQGYPESQWKSKEQNPVWL